MSNISPREEHLLTTQNMRTSFPKSMCSPEHMLLDTKSVSRQPTPSIPYVAPQAWEACCVAPCQRSCQKQSQLQNPAVPAVLSKYAEVMGEYEDLFVVDAVLIL